MTEYEAFHQALEDQGIELVRGMAKCPAHMDLKASLHVTEGDNGRVLAYCFAGCRFADVVASLGLDLAQSEGPRAVDQYIYTDRGGTPLVRVTRRDPKGFSQEHWDGSGWVTGVPPEVPRPLYNVREVVSAARHQRRVYLVEGEKDVEVLRLFGEVGTTNLGGVGAWDRADRSALAGADVIIVADDDEPGRAGAEHRAATLSGGEARSVLLALPRSGKDLTDHLYAGHSLDDLKAWDEDYWDDWESEPPVQDWLLPGIFERGTINWVYGDRGAGKSLFLNLIGADLANKGMTVATYDEENPDGTVRRRLWRIKPDRRHFKYRRASGLDLADPDQVTGLISHNQNTDLLVFDSFSRVYRGGSDKASETVVDCINALTRIRTATGATIIMIDHTGHGHWREDGTVADPTHARGSSAKGQQADMEVQFLVREKWERGKPFRFRIVNNKAARVGNPFDLKLAIVDTPSGGLALMDEAGSGIFQGETVEDSAVEEATISPPSAAEVEEAGPGVGDVNAKPPSSTPDTRAAFKAAKERLALERLKRELGATEVEE